VTTADTLLGIRSVGGLDPGSASQGDSPLTVPIATPEGLYYLGAIADDAGEVIEPDELDNVVVAGSTLEVHAPPLSDLVPSFVTFSPGTVDAGQNIAISEGVLNQGDASATGFQVGVYLSTDPVLDTGDVLIGMRLLGTLDPGSESTVNGLPLQIPPDTQAGTYFVGSWADDTELVPEKDEGNNRLVALSTLTVNVPPLPDLVAEQVQFSPGVINADLGELLHVQELVENHGPAAAGSFRVGVYISSNSVVTASDILISSRQVSALGSGAGTGATVDVELPVGVSDGTYFVAVIADDLDMVGELSEGNNVLLASGTLDVVSSPDPKPNLITEEVTYSGNKRQPGETFQLVTRVTNAGDLSAPPFHVGVFLSVDDQITTDDTLIGERFLLAGLGAGFSSVASAPVTIPADTPVGDYYVGASADNRFVVDESDEDDNAELALGTLEVYIPPPPAPELGVTSISHDGAVHVPGDTVSIDDTIHNDGEVDAGAFRVAYYLSDDPWITTDDLLLATRTLVSLAAGEESSDTTVIVIPPGTAPGTWWLGLVVDDQDSVAENDEDDNDETALPSIEVQ
jgi:subtilase family serine protease